MSSRGICGRRISVIDLGAVSTSCLFERPERESVAARQELDGVAASFREALSSELYSASEAVSASAAGGDEWSFVHLGRGNGKTHVVANRALKMLPVFEWKATCGWKFGLAEYSLSPVPGPLSGRCRGCFRVRGEGAVDGCSSSG